MFDKPVLKRSIIVLLIVFVLAWIVVNTGCVTCAEGYKQCKATCVLAENQCPCETDDDCASESVNNHCNTVSGLCVECLSDGHCGAGKICEANNCIPGCRDDSDCTSGTPHCYQRWCVKCASDADCSSPTPRCKISWIDNQPSGNCVQCTSHSDCPANYYCEFRDNSCQENRGICCIHSADAVTFTCSQLVPPATACVAENLWNEYVGLCNEVPICNSGGVCPSERPRCDATEGSGSTTYLCCAPGKCSHKPSGLPLCLN